MPPAHLTVLTGASRGLGHAMALRLLGPDRLLLCISRRTDDALAHEAQRLGAHLEQWSQDLADAGEAADRLERWLKSLHASSLDSATLINNAGVIPRIGPIDQCPAAELSQSLRVGLEAPLLMAAAFLRVTQGWVDAGWRGPRKLLNISSGLGRRAMAGQGPYCAAKAGMDHWSRCTALDEAQRANGARVVSLAPGVIDTAMQDQLRAGDPAGFPDRGNFIALKTNGQLASPEAAAERVLAFLARDTFGQDPVADVRG